MSGQREVMAMSQERSENAKAVCFVTTHWTRVLATRGETVEAREALADLCAAYYEPVVAVLRSEQRDDDRARELAHAFFERILERHGLEGADPARGRFRSYLLGALKHFMANHRQAALRSKRGGDVVHESIDAAPSGTAAFEVMDPAPWPDAAAFDRAWALQLIQRALDRLSKQEADAGSLREFRALTPWLTGDAENSGRTQGAVAVELGMSEGAVRVAVHRLRRRFRKAVREEIGRTVAGPADVSDELQTLIAALGNVSAGSSHSP